MCAVHPPGNCPVDEQKNVIGEDDMTKLQVQKMLRRLPAHVAAGAIVGVVGLASAPAFAQDSTATEDARQDIVVTARFREENLQDTPIAISAVNATTIENSVILDIAGIQKFVPNVQLGRIAFAGNSLSASIRGVSFADLEKTFDPAVGVAIDGVFLGTNTGANVDFSDIEQVEVLRGPQGTLFGRNTVGGILSIRRTRPTGELGARLHARYGSHNTADFDAVINMPKIGDAVSIKLTGQRKTSDSFTRDRVSGKREDGRDFYNIGMSILAELGSDTSILGSIEYMKDRSNYPSSVNLTKANGLPFGAGGTICDFTRAIGAGDLGCDTLGALRQAPERFRFANTTIPFESFLDGWAGSLELKSKLGGFNMTAVTGYRDTSDSLLEENTGAPLIPLAPGFAVPLAVASRDQDYKQFSQEIRIQGDITDRVDLVAGVYYLHTDYKIRPGVFNGSNIATFYILGGPAQRIDSAQTLDSYAIFAESIVKLGNDVRLTVGGRYTSETKKFSTALTLPPVGAFAANLKATFKDPTWRFILDWKPSEDMLLYASWSRGFRSGGFNGRGTTPTSIGPYDPERVDSYELGFKTSFADNKVRFNSTIFQADYNDKQEEILRAAPFGGGTETLVQNAASARIRGIELELMATPTPDLNLRASGAHLDAKYRSFLLPDLTRPGSPLIDVSASRNFRRAPKYTFNAGADYTLEIGSGKSVNMTVDYVYTDDTFVSAISDTTGARRDIVPARGSVDASLALIHEGDGIKNFRLSGYVRDLFHKGGGRLGASLDAGIFYFGVVIPAREFGLEAVIKF
jgi:iron complex outermembrane recepter protein